MIMGTKFFTQTLFFFALFSKLKILIKKYLGDHHPWHSASTGGHFRLIFFSSFSLPNC